MAETRFGVYSVRGEELGQRPHPIPLLLRTAWRRGGRRRGRGAQRGPHPRAGRHSWEAGALTWTPGLRARRGGRQPGGFLNPLPWPGPHFPSTAPPREGERALAGQPSSSAQEAREPATQSAREVSESSVSRRPAPTAPRQHPQPDPQAVRPRPRAAPP